MKENTVSLEFLIDSFKKGNKGRYLQQTNNLARRHDMVQLLSLDSLLVELLSAQSVPTQTHLMTPLTKSMWQNEDETKLVLVLVLVLMLVYLKSNENEDDPLLGPLENVVRVRKLKNASGDPATGDVTTANAGAAGRCRSSNYIF